MLFNKRNREGIPKSLLLVLGVAWVWMTWSDHSGQMPQAGEVDEEVILQYYDRDLRLSEAGKRGNAYERWMSGADDDGEWLERSRESIRDLYLADLGVAGEGILDAIALRLGETVTPVNGSDDIEYREEMKDFLLAGDGQAWEFELFLNQESDREVLAYYHEENDRLLDRSMWSSNFNNAVLVIGLALAGHYCFWGRHVAQPGSRVPDSWAATSILGAFFLADLLLTPWMWILNLGYDSYSALGGSFDIYFLYDVCWRVFPPLVVAVIFLKYPHRIWRVFGLEKRIDWLLLVGGLAVLSFVDWVFYFIMPKVVSDPTDFIETTSPDPILFVSLLFSSVVIAPFFEEFTFRGFLFKGLKSKTGVWTAATVSSILFAIVHTQYDIWGWISIGTMGMVACYLTQRTGSLKTAIAFHAMGNLLISLDVYLFYQLPL